MASVTIRGVVFKFVMFFSFPSDFEKKPVFTLTLNVAKIGLCIPRQLRRAGLRLNDRGPCATLGPKREEALDRSKPLSFLLIRRCHFLGYGVPKMKQSASDISER